MKMLSGTFSLDAMYEASVTVGGPCSIEFIGYEGGDGPTLLYGMLSKPFDPIEGSRKV